MIELFVYNMWGVSYGSNALRIQVMLLPSLALERQEPTQPQEWHFFYSWHDHPSLVSREHREQSANVHNKGGNFVFADGHTEYRKHWERESGDYGLIHPQLRASMPYVPTTENCQMDLDAAF